MSLELHLLNECERGRGVCVSLQCGKGDPRFIVLLGIKARSFVAWFKDVSFLCAGVWRLKQNVAHTSKCVTEFRRVGFIPGYMYMLLVFVSSLQFYVCCL